MTIAAAISLLPLENYCAEARAKLAKYKSDNRPICEAPRKLRLDGAYHKDTPARVLTALAKDEDYGVRYGVAGNPKTPARALASLAKDEDPYVRCRVALNPKTPAKALALLAKDEDPSVRERVARNQNSIMELRPYQNAVVGAGLSS